jgi:transcription elongation factor GreA
MDKVPMTPEGHAAMHTELAHLKSVERPRISKEIGIAREHGDLRENAEYHAAKDKQGMIEARIRELEDKIARAEVIDPTSFSGDKIKFGARVTLEDVDSGKTVEYRIVGPDEASMEKGTISVTAPLSRALIGRMSGDEVTVKAPGGERTYSVMQVRWS